MGSSQYPVAVFSDQSNRRYSVAVVATKRSLHSCLITNDGFDFSAAKLCQSDTSTSLSVTGVEAPLNFPTLAGQVLRITTILLHGSIKVICLL